MLRPSRFAAVMLLALAASPAGAGFPTTPVLDDFNRPDGPLAADPNWAEAWRFFNNDEEDRTQVIESGRIMSEFGGGSPAESGASAWLPLVAADVEAYVTWSELPTPPPGGGRGSEIQVRTQSLPLGHLNYYSCEVMIRSTPPDEINIVWQRGENDFAYVAQAMLTDVMTAGDVFGVRIEGDRLECWRVHATTGGGFQAGEGELMLAADMPGSLGPGYIVLRTTDTDDIRWDDFGGGVYPWTGPPIDPPVPEPEFPSTPLLDDFERPDGALEEDPTWDEAWRFFGGNEADRGHARVSGQIESAAGAANPPESGASAWLPLVAADVEAYVTWSALPTPAPGKGAGSEIQVRTQSLPLGHLDYYSCEMSVHNGGPDQIGIVWQQGEGVSQYVAQDTLADPFTPGDQVGVRILGSRLECWRVHASDAGGFQIGDRELMLAADMPGGLGAGYVVLRTSNDGNIRWDEFGGGVYPPPSPAVPALGAAALGLLAGALLLGGRRILAHRAR